MQDDSGIVQAEVQQEEVVKSDEAGDENGDLKEEESEEPVLTGWVTEDG